MSLTSSPIPVPIASPPAFTHRGNALELIEADEIQAVLGDAVNSLRAWLSPAALLPQYSLANYQAHLAVEMLHILSSLDKSTALCAAELEDKPLQELFIKCAFHSNRLRTAWDAIGAQLTGTPLDALEPITSTLIFQLALEELAKKDALAFAYALDLFGTPGNASSISGVAHYFEVLLLPPAAIALVRDWQRTSLANAVSYASVETSKDHGYPLAGSYGDTCARHLRGLLARDVETSLLRVTALADQFHLFYRGVQIFYAGKQLSFPRRRLNWLEV